MFVKRWRRASRTALGLPTASRSHVTFDGGPYGRAYDFDAPKGQRVREIAGGGGNFELELSDLTKRFHTIRATT